jgi:hypothetical protein
MENIKAKRYNRITYKDLMSLMDIQETAAKKYIRDMREHYAVPILMVCHFFEYFKVPNSM